MSNTLVPVGDMQIMARAIGTSGLFGKTEQQTLALMLIAQAEGRHPASVAMQYDIIQGRPALRSQAALMRFQEAGGKVEWIERTDAKVTAKFSHSQGGTVEVSWDMARAKSMGYDGKDNWRKQPMIMLQWRVVAEGVRTCYPACLGGMYLDSEVRDFEPNKAQDASFEVLPSTPAKPAEVPPEQPTDAKTGKIDSANVYLTCKEMIALKLPDGSTYNIQGVLTKEPKFVKKSATNKSDKTWYQIADATLDGETSDPIDFFAFGSPAEMVKAGDTIRITGMIVKAWGEKLFHNCDKNDIQVVE